MSLWICPFCENKPLILEILLNCISGIFGVVITAIVSVIILKKQLRVSNKSINYSNQLKLKELFNSKRNWKVHSYFSGEPVSCPSLLEIYDYLGFYEIAYDMKVNEQVNEYDFFNTYFYRIEVFSRNEIVIQIIEKEYLFWEKLVDLIILNLEWGLENKRISKNEYHELKAIYVTIQNNKR